MSINVVEIISTISTSLFAYALLDVVKVAIALWFNQDSASAPSPLLLALTVLVFINAHRLTAVLVNTFERTPDTPTNGTLIVSIHKRILAALTALIVVEIGATYLITIHLTLAITPFTLLCAILAVTQPARLWRIIARYAIESFDRYAASTGLAQARKHALIGGVEICFHAFQLVNGLAFAGLVMLFYRASPFFSLRRNQTMFVFVTLQLGVQVALAVFGAARQLLRFHHQAGYVQALVHRLPTAEKSHADSLCVICREESPTDGDEKEQQQAQLRTQLACRHAFHRDCLVMWLAWSLHCPICRTPCKTVADDHVVQAPVLSAITLYT